MQGVNLLDKLGTCPGNSRWNTRFKSYAFADDLSEDLRNAFCNAEDLLCNAELIKNSRSTTAGIFVVAGTRYFIKRSNVYTFVERLRRVGRLPRALRNMFIARELKKISVKTPEVLMALSTRPHGLPGASYLITEYLPDPMNLAEQLPEMITHYNSQKRLFLEVCRMVVKMHRAGIEHGDLKMVNILALADDDSGYELGVFDLDGSRKFSAPCSEHVCCREVARLASSFYLTMQSMDHEKLYDCRIIADEWLQAYREAGGRDLGSQRYYYQKMEKFLHKKIFDR